ncbi:PRD domain-containing protein [Bacillus timonensis]|nr:PRD domain-containing protein [Bacillus timonensis]
MRINKILNNNAVVIKEDNQEKIVMGPGIAFQKGKNDLIDNKKIEKIFVMKEGNERFQELLQIVPEEHIALAEEIISYAEGELQVPLSNHIHISLTDHLSFALERLQQGYMIHNKLLSEIKVLYPSEFKIGLWAKEHIKTKLDVEIPEDEVGHIAIHLHTAKLNSSNMENTLKQTTMISEMIDLIEHELNVSIAESSISYQRLLTHLRFAINRAEQNEPFHSMDPEMLHLLKTKYELAFITAEKMADYAQKEYGLIFPLSEIGYISLHIQRIIDKI